VLVTVALLWAAPGPAIADVDDDHPATASRGPGELYVFARGESGEILERHRVAGSWSDWSSIGGSAGSGPAAVAYRGDILVFVRGTDGGVYQNALRSGRWTGWDGLGGATASASAPSVSVRRGTSNALDLMVRGQDNAVYQRTFAPATGWTPFSTIGGIVASAPAVASQSDEVISVFARAPDGSLLHREYGGRAWSSWVGFGGGSLGAPAAVSRSAGVLNVYARGTDETLYTRSWTAAAGWGAWVQLDASARLSSAPAGASDGPDHEWVVARIGGGIALKEWTRGAGWGPWQDVDATAVPSPAPASTEPPPSAAATPPSEEISLPTGLGCTPARGKLRVSMSIKTPKGRAKPRVIKVVFFTKGKGSRVRVDRTAPFQVHIPINRPAGTTGRVYARVYYKRGARGKTLRKVVSRRYKVCR
jgi:hypothetical protein